jgi:hypothetical protein
LCRGPIQAAELSAAEARGGKIPRWENAASRLIKPWPADQAIRCPATGYRKIAVGRSGDCDIFHNLPTLCLLIHCRVVNRYCIFSQTWSHNVIFNYQWQAGKDQIVGAG